MKKILTVVGARPQIIKSAALSSVINAHFSGELMETIVHTGQHYDSDMSEVFFKELNIREPQINFNVGNRTPGLQVAEIISKLEIQFEKEKPDCMLVYGDTNSTLGAAISASQANIPLVHIEAGLRSHKKSMPEEVNRIITDHLSTILFSPTLQGIENLQNEGLYTDQTKEYGRNNPMIFHCGDIMLDNFQRFSQQLDCDPGQLNLPDVVKQPYSLLTIHRDNNTNNPQRLSALIRAIISLVQKQNINIIFPIHPRTRKALVECLDGALLEELNTERKIILINPVSYLGMLYLELNADIILTDSGGVQKEAFFAQKPCIILREETEWVELVGNGNAIIADVDSARISSAYSSLSLKSDYTWPPFYGDGNAGKFICEKILELLAKC